MKNKKNLPSNGRLGKTALTCDKLSSFVCVDKKTLISNLKQFQAGVKKKEEVEANADVFFEHLRRFNLGVK